MKTTTIALAIALMASTSVMANSAIDNLNVEAVKASVQPTVIKTNLDNWYKAELDNIDATAHQMSDRVPYIVRQRQAKANLDAEYAKLTKAYGL